MPKGEHLRGPRIEGSGKFGSWFAGRLSEENITTQQFADMLRCSRASISCYINQKNKPPYINVVAICYYLGESPIDIWKLVEEDWGE